MQTGLGRKLAQEPSPALAHFGDALRRGDERLDLERLAVDLAAEHELSTGIAGQLQSHFQADRAAFRFSKDFHLVDEQLQIINRRLIRHIDLPVIARGSLAGYPRIYALAFSLVANVDGDLDAETASRFLRAYQTVNPLTIREIRAFDLTLRIVLLQKLKRFAERITSVAHDELTSVLGSLSTLDWHKLIQNVSLVDAILEEDKAGVYSAMDFASQEHYRRVIERLAKRTELSELAVARHAIEMTSVSSSRPERAHVGYYLIDDGVPELERALHYRPTLRERLRRAARKHPTPLPRIDTSSGIPESALTIFVVAANFSSLTGVKELLARFEANYLANQDRNIFFALRGDWKTPTTEVLPDDEMLLGVVQRSISELNARYSDGPYDRFHLFHRTTTAAEPDFLKQVCFVISLDSDTELPRDSARKLVGAMLHPLNRPQWNDDMVQLRRGYATLEPEVNPPVKRDDSRIPRLLSGHLGSNLAYWRSRKIRGETETSADNMTSSVRLNARASLKLIEDSPHGETCSPERLLAWTMAAHDLGVVSRVELLERMEATLAGIAESHEQGITPPQILLSETGNLAAFLRVLPHRCRDLLLQPIFDACTWEGLSDTLLLVKNALTARGDANAHDLSKEVQKCLGYVPAESRRGLRTTSDCARLINIMQQRAAVIEALFESFVDECPGIDVAELRLWVNEFSRHARALQREVQLFAPWLQVQTDHLDPIIRNHRPDLLDLWSHIRRSLDPIPIIALRPERLQQLQPKLAQLRGELASACGTERTTALRRCAELAVAIEDALRVASDVKLRYEELARRCQSIEAAHTPAKFDDEYRLMQVQFQVNTEFADQKLNLSSSV